jgi:K+-transporting ATPase KdpF subunit
MSIEFILSAIVAFGLFIYLFYSLFRPERF